jgi:acyl dehydratase
MWAGGSIQLKPNGYLDYARCCTAGTVMAGTEQIKHVRLHGEGDTAKIFVTIERRFAGLEDAERGVDKGKHGKRPPGVSVHPQEARGDLTQQLRAKVDDGWGDAVLKEERNLVFFKERTAAELEAVKAGQMATVKYLDPPGNPDFSHTLTPNRALLFRFSALTFNAHLIHLDPDYARNVEGHRNLLVHGPLSLTLMLKTVNHYVHQQTKGKQVVESIEYRNLAPLYCDEEMRICCLEKKKLQNGSIYDVWIEGPTGGVAVKGTLRTTTNDTWAKKDTGIAQTHSATPTDELKTRWPSFKRPEHPKLKRKLLNTTNRARKMAKSSKNGTQVHVASEDQRPSQDSPAPPSSEPTTNPETSANSESSTSSEPSTQNQEK